MHSLQVRWHSKIKDVKDLLHISTGIPPSRQQLFQSNSSIPLSSSLTLHCLSIDRSGYTLRLSVIDTNVIGAAGFIMNHAHETSLDQECSNILSDIRSGLKRENMPIKTDVLDCTGGVYFMRAICGRKVAVFKPFDEEQGMPNNTKGYQGTGILGLRQFTKPGHGCIREVAAYIMDVGNFCGVPPTMLVHCEHPVLYYPAHGGTKGHPYPKLGSLQKFVHALDTFEDIGPRLISILEVQKVALLDLRLLNGDRNASNILAISKRCVNVDDCCPGTDGCESPVVNNRCTNADSEADNISDSYTLIPIDHGYCFPSRLLINELDWAWFYYPQVNQPVHDDIKQYLAKLDLGLLLKGMLAQVSLSEESIFLTKVSHKLVVDGVAAGLTLFEIANIVVRVKDDCPSPLERAIEEAEENAYRTIEMRVSAMSRSPRAIEEGPNDFRDFSKVHNRKRASSAECNHTVPRSLLVGAPSDDMTEKRCTSKDHLPLTMPSFKSQCPRNLSIGPHCATKGVRFIADGPLSRIDESSSCTDSSGTNTPSIGTFDTMSPAMVQSLLGGLNDLKLVSMPDQDVHSSGCSTPGASASCCDIRPPRRSRTPRFPYVDADEALESRLGSPVSIPTSAHKSENFACVAFRPLDFTGDTFPIVPSLPSIRMKRVNTLNYITSPEIMSPCEFDTWEQDSKVRITDFSVDGEGSDQCPVPTSLCQQHVPPSSALTIDDPLYTECVGFGNGLDLGTKSSDTGGTDGYCDDDEDDMYTTDADGSPSSAPPSPTAIAAISFLRVTSFSAFSSAPIYDASGGERRTGKLQKERRRQIALTTEFSRTRLLFAENSIITLITKSIKLRGLTASAKENL